MIIKVKRGTKAQIEATTLEEGELAFAIDTNELYIGTSTGKAIFSPLKDILTVRANLLIPTVISTLETEVYTE